MSIGVPIYFILFLEGMRVKSMVEREQEEEGYLVESGYALWLFPKLPVL
jgi:hypothetical protein